MSSRFCAGVVSKLGLLLSHIWVVGVVPFARTLQPPPSVAATCLASCTKNGCPFAIVFAALHVSSRPWLYPLQKEANSRFAPQAPPLALLPALAVSTTLYVPPLAPRARNAFTSAALNPLIGWCGSSCTAGVTSPLLLLGPLGVPLRFQGLVAGALGGWVGGFC